MDRDEKAFHEAMLHAARNLEAALAGVDPSVARAAALRVSARLALRGKVRRGLFEQATSEHYLDAQHEIRPAPVDHRPLALVVPIRRAI